MYKNSTTKLGIPNLVYHKILLIMRLTTVLLIASLLQVSASTSAQRITMNQRNVSLETILKEIRTKTAYSFVYDVEAVNKVQNVSVSVTGAEIDDVLKKALSGLDLGYKIDGKIVSIMKKKEASWLEKLLASIEVQGKVVDQNGVPIPGVTVIVKGTTIGTRSDKYGVFTITVPDSKSVLVFSFLGFKTQEIPVKERNKIDVTLEESIAKLDEVALISNGYQKIKPEQSTGSISTIREKEYNSRINTTDFLAGLQNKIPGLLINNDVKFEGNSLFQIRGISTINGSKTPLIVIDGYPTELSLASIDPNDIESVTVLKDAAAATIYGVRASNGVIVIERKKARTGKVNVNFRGTAGFTPKENYERYRWDENGSKIYLDFYRADNSNIDASLWDNMNNPNTGWQYPYPAPGAILAQQAANVITPAQANQQFAELGAYNNTKDYSSLFLRTAFTQTQNLDVSGGNENALYYITANYSDMDASRIKNGNDRFRLSGRTTINFSKRFSMDLNTDLQIAKSNSVPIPDINNIYIFERFQNENGDPLPLFNGSYVNSYYNKAIIARGLYDNMYYPLVDVNEVSDKSKTTSNHVTASFRYNLGKGFNLNFGGVYESSHTDTRHLANENSSEVHQLVNRYTKNASSGFTYGLPQGGYLRQGNASTEGYTVRTLLNYDKQISENHSLNVILGGELRAIVSKSNYADYFGYNDQTLFNQLVNYKQLSDDTTQPQYAGRNPVLDYKTIFDQNFNENRYVSAYSNVVYAYKRKYSLTGSIRVDQSNLFGLNAQYRYKPLWSLGAGWSIDKENFMQNLKWVNSLKLRIAEGFNGNVAPNALPQVIATRDQNNFGSAITPSLLLKSYANSRLRWEQTRNFNAGLDYTIFKNITGSVDYYVKKSTDVLANNQIDATKGGTSALTNQASIRNTGLEFSLHADWIARRDFNWNTGLVLARNTSKVLKVYNTNITSTAVSNAYVTGANANYLEGYAIGSLFSYRYAGVSNTGFPMIYDKDGNAKRLLDNDQGKDELDYVGSSIPTFNLGLSNRVDIGHFYIYAMINYYGGFKVRLPIPNAAALRPLEGAGEYWKVAGDENNPNILRAASSSGYDYAIQASDKFTVNGAYFTLGDLTGSYSFRNSRLVKKVGISNLEIKLQASNLYTVALNKQNYSLATGSYEKSYLTPTYTIGLDINF